MLNNQKVWLGVGVLAVLGFFGLLSYSIFYLDVDSTVINVVPPSRVIGGADDRIDPSDCEGCARRFIDGVYVKKNEENIFPFAVVIDNNVEARPQHGISKANVVYEVEVEGGITRFFALFADGEDVSKIGPIRSVRPYMIDVANEYSSLLAHVGGSPQALARIMKDGIFSANEFYNENFFWREKSRSAPFNVYTSSDEMEDFLSKKEAKEGKFFSWKFKSDDAEALSSVNAHAGVKIDYNIDEYDVEWRYNKEANEYVRYVDNEIFEDGDGGQIRVKNVVVQYAPMSIVDVEGRLNVEMVGEGEALLCRDGGCDAVNWTKNTPGKRTRFYNLDEEVEFNAGKIWVNIVRSSYDVDY